MRYTMYCPDCDRSFVVRGTEEEDTNSFTPNEEDFGEHQEAMGCLHESSYVTHSEWDDEP